MAKFSTKLKILTASLLGGTGIAGITTIALSQTNVIQVENQKAATIAGASLAATSFAGVTAGSIALFTKTAKDSKATALREAKKDLALVKLVHDKYGKDEVLNTFPDFEKQFKVVIKDNEKQAKKSKAEQEAYATLVENFNKLLKADKANKVDSE